jgi:DNA polymerase (family X)
MEELNLAVARTLRDIALSLRLRGDSPWKARAYDRAAERVLATGGLGELVRAGRLEDLPGIGVRLATQIGELVTTGQSSYYELLRRDVPPGAGELLRVQGLGPERIRRLWQELGIGDLDALERACMDGKVRTLAGFGPKTEARLLEEARRVKLEKPLSHVLGARALELLEPLVAALEQLPAVIHASIAGQARRFTEVVTELSAVVATRDPDAVLAALARDSLVRGVVQGPGHVRLEIYKSELPVDVLLVEPDVFGTSLWRATGPPAHVAELEARGPISASEREQEVYEGLGLSMVAPELRDHGDLAWAAARSRELVEVADVQGVVHSHTTWSDGHASLREMALAAQARGFHYMTSTDHGETAHYAGGMSRHELLRQRAEIDALNAELPDFEILSGVESDIRENGELDYDGALLDELDVVIGSIHQRYKQDRATMTARVRAALANPRLQIWGHPTGRLIDKRDPAAMDMDELLAMAASAGVVVEINGSPDRLDLSDLWAKRALGHGLRLVVSADSHREREIDNVRYAVLVARRAGARREDVLNTQPVEELVRGLR